MKASESVQNYKSSVRMYSNYIVRDIKKVCKEVGPRPSASECEKKAQEHYADELKTCTDEVELEEFKVAPHAFMSWIVVDGILMILAVIFSFLNLAIVSVGLSVFAFMCLTFEFLLYKQFLDKFPIFPKKAGYNVIGRKKPTGEIKQRIVFCGHADSAWEWTYTHLGGKVLLIAMMAISVVGMLFVLLASIFSVIAGDSYGSIVSIIQYVQLGFVPFFVAICFFTNFKRPVMGANDNLTGATCSVAVLKFLKDNNIDFENTEIIGITSSSEEAGLRGAKALAKKHAKEFTDIPTAFIGLDTLKDYEFMTIYQRDMNGLVKNDTRVCNLLKKAGEIADVELPFGSVCLGASDAAAVSQAGIPAATLASMNPDAPKYYHTRLDTEEILNQKTIEKCLDICLQAVFIFDEQGLVQEYK